MRFLSVVAILVIAAVAVVTLRTSTQVPMYSLFLKGERVVVSNLGNYAYMHGVTERTIGVITGYEQDAKLGCNKAIVRWDRTDGSGYYEAKVCQDRIKRVLTK